MLNKDQEKAKKDLISFSNNNLKEIILSGRAGTGKTYLLNSFLKDLKIPKHEILVLAPTHEALKNLRENIQNIPENNFKTVHASLGISPILSEKELKFEQRRLPSIWENIQLAIIDECSMLDDVQYDILQQVHSKIIYVGDGSQLPAVNIKRGVFDKCISTIFSKQLQELSLTIPMRNSGSLWDYTNRIQELIYNNINLYPTSEFDIQKTNLKELLHGEKQKNQFLEGDLKIILWTNNGVKAYNERIRKVIFPFLEDNTKYSRYVIGDNIILTSAYIPVPFMEVMDEKKLLRFKDEEPLYTNTKGIVLTVEKVTVKLNKQLLIPCFKLQFKHSEGVSYIYEPYDVNDHKKIEEYYLHVAYGKKNKFEKDAAFKVKHFIQKCFAKIHHSYAGTAHRFQGSSIQNVVVINNDIDKNPCVVERKKCRYVAVSRAMHNLYMYRGI